MFKEWKKIKNNSFKNIDEILNFLHKNKYQVSPWIKNIFTNGKNKIELNEKEFLILKVNLLDLGFNKPAKLIDIYKTFKKFNLGLVPPFVSLLARTMYDDQPKGEWLRIAVPLESMVDSDGVPHLPKLGSALNMLFIETYWSYPGAIFHPHNEFLVVKK
jgi:hypothetical protein